LQEQQYFKEALMDWDKTFEDTFIVDVEIADLENGIQVENPFAFVKCQSVLVEPRKSTPSTAKGLAI
jgi:hypothetical protein